MHSEDIDVQFMHRCLQLASFAEGCTSPNPMVGAVVVHDGKIIGEGYHHKAGEPHAERMAIASVIDRNLLSESTLYVSLEPCSHQGRTPPCADFVVECRFKRVVVAMLDPNPLVAGRGMQKLHDAGIATRLGVLEHEARHLNRRFLMTFEHHRPYVILKWAQTADAFIDICRETPAGGPIKISNKITKTLNHQLRSTEDAIMVATRTALLDNPHLTINKWTGRNPLRVLLDMKGIVPSTSKIFDRQAHTLVVTSRDGACKLIRERAQALNADLLKNFALNSFANTRGGYTLPDDNIEYLVVDEGKAIYPQILHNLYQRDIQSIIIEGGAAWLNTVIDSGIWDEARIEQSPATIHAGVKAPQIDGTTVAVHTFGCNNIRTIINPNPRYL